MGSRFGTKRAWFSSFRRRKPIRRKRTQYPPSRSVLNPRLIDGVYQASCVLAAVWIAFHFGAITLKGSRIAINHGVNVAFVGTALIWFAGRALRYVRGRQVTRFHFSPLSACASAPRVSFTRLPARCSTAAVNAAFATMTLRQSARISVLCSCASTAIAIRPSYMRDVMRTRNWDCSETGQAQGAPTRPWPACIARGRG